MENIFSNLYNLENKTVNAIDYNTMMDRGKGLRKRLA